MSAQRGGAELERRAGPRSKLPIAAVGRAPIYVALEPLAFIGLARTELVRNDDSMTALRRTLLLRRATLCRMASYVAHQSILVEVTLCFCEAMAWLLHVETMVFPDIRPAQVQHCRKARSADEADHGRPGAILPLLSVELRSQPETLETPEMDLQTW